MAAVLGLFPPGLAVTSIIGITFPRACTGDGTTDIADIGGAAAGTGGAAPITTDMAVAATAIALQQGTSLPIAASMLEITAIKSCSDLFLEGRESGPFSLLEFSRRCHGPLQRSSAKCEDF
jgi:hypothetical protein